MQHEVDPELRAICQEILRRDQSLDEWRATESGDEFQREHYHGGFEAIEDAFCFSYYDSRGREWWFHFTLGEAAEIAIGKRLSVDVREATARTLLRAIYERCS